MQPQLFPCIPNEPWIVSLQPSHRNAIAWISVVFICSLYYVLPLCLAWVLYAVCMGPRLCALIVATALGILACMPMNEWIAARRFCQVYYQIFRVRHNVSEERINAMLERWSKGERYILGMHPHGVIPIQTLLWAAYADQYLRTPELGTLYGFGGMATIVTRMPFMRSIMGWLSGLGADYATLKRGLTGSVFKRPATGHNLYMLPGGLAEIFTAQPGTHKIVWNRRRGLVRLALETGARLTPLYVFGGNDFFHQLSTSDSYLGRTSRRLGISFTLFWGSLCAPIVPLVPKHGVTIAIGEPLPSRRTQAVDGKPTDAEIEELHAAYADAMRDVFEEYKSVAGYPDAELQIL